MRCALICLRRNEYRLRNIGLMLIDIRKTINDLFHAKLAAISILQIPRMDRQMKLRSTYPRMNIANM